MTDEWQSLTHCFAIWLDGLDPDEAIETILQAKALQPPGDLEKALSAWAFTRSPGNSCSAPRQTA